MAIYYTLMKQIQFLALTLVTRLQIYVKIKCLQNLRGSDNSDFSYTLYILESNQNKKF